MSLGIGEVDVVALAKGDEKLGRFNFDFGAAVLLSSAVKCSEEMLEYAHIPLTLLALANRCSNIDVFGPAIISIGGRLLALSDPASPHVAPVMIQSSGARLRTAPVISGGGGCGGNGTLTAVALNVGLKRAVCHFHGLQNAKANQVAFTL